MVVFHYSNEMSSKVRQNSIENPLEDFSKVLQSSVRYKKVITQKIDDPIKCLFFEIKMRIK